MLFMGWVLEPWVPELIVGIAGIGHSWHLDLLEGHQQGMVAAEFQAAREEFTQEGSLSIQSPSQNLRSPEDQAVPAGLQPFKAGPDRSHAASQQYKPHGNTRARPGTGRMPCRHRIIASTRSSEA